MLDSVHERTKHSQIVRKTQEKKGPDPYLTGIWSKFQPNDDGIQLRSKPLVEFVSDLGYNALVVSGSQVF